MSDVTTTTQPRRPMTRLILAGAVVALALAGAALPAAAAQPGSAPPVSASTAGASTAVANGATAADRTHGADRSDNDQRRVPRLVTQWAEAWKAAAAEDLAALFTTRGTYQDFAFGATFSGRAEIAEWVRITHSSIADLDIDITDAFRAGDRISVRWTFSGQIIGAPQPFSVPVSTVMEISRGKISYNGDYYNLAEVLAQSGLPADTTF